MTVSINSSRHPGNAIRLLRAGMLLCGAFATAFTTLADLAPVAGPATSLEFTGSQTVNLAAFPLANTSFTIEMWAKRATLNGEHFIYGQGPGAPNQGLHIGFRTSNQFTFAFWANDLNVGPYTDTDWHHWACTYDATTRTRKIYRDGVLAGSDIAPAHFQGTGPALLGNVPWAGNFYKGEIADLRIWSVTRSAQEVADNRHASLLPNTTGLLANYRFNEGWGSIVNDLAVSASAPDQGGEQDGTTANEPVFLGSDAVLSRHANFAPGEGMSIPNFGAIAPTDSITIEFWVNPAAEGNSTLYLAPDNDSNRLNIHVPWFGGLIYWDFGNIFSGGRLLYQPPASVVGKWNHFAFVAGNNSMKIYQNGVLVSSRAGSSTLTPVAERSIAMAPNGRMADFRIWNVERTATEIAQNRFTAVAPNSPGLLINYRFNDNNTAFGLPDFATGNGAQNASISGTTVFARTSWQTLSGLIPALPVVESTPKLLYLPAADSDSALSYSTVTSPHGTLIPMSGGVFQYTANAGYSGADTVTYVVTDGARNSTGVVNVAVGPRNDSPVAGAGTSVNLNMIGASQYIDVPDGVWFGNTFTVEGWVFVRAYGNFSRFFDFANGPNNNNVLGALSEGTSGLPRLGVYQAGVEQAITSSQQIPLNTWTHLAYTRDAGGIGHIYLNGVEVASGAVWAPLNVTRTINYFGRSNWSFDSDANASFGEIRIWDIARTAQQISAGANASLAPTTPGLILDYHLNEGSGTTAFDSATADAGGAQNGTVVNSPGWMPADGPLTSIALNGSGQYSQTLDSPEISITGPITIEAWIRPNAPGSLMGIVEKYGNADGGYALRMEANGRITFHTLDTASLGTSVTSGTTVPINAWTHVAAVWDGVQSRIFINGMLDGSALTGRNPKNGSTQLFIGQLGTGTYYFNGRIGDVRIWDVARSAIDIVSSLGGIASNTPGLVLNYKFNEATGTAINDSATGNGAQNGSLVGAPTWPTPEVNLAQLEAIKFTEDTSVDFVLPAFDSEGAALTYSGVSASAGTLALISGNLYRFTPTSNFNGPVTVTYTVSDGTTPATGRVYLQGVPVDDPPTLDVIPTQTIGEGSPTSTLPIVLTDGDPELTQGLSITATSSDPTLVRNPGILYTSPAETAQLTFKPRPGRSGTATITVTVTDLVSLQTIVRSFDVVVTAVDDPPNVGPATSLEFNGANYVRVPAFGSAVPSDEITIEFWQKAGAAAAQTSIVLSPDNPANRLSVQAPAANGAVVWDFGNSGGNGRLTYTPPVSVVGSWQHFAFVASRSGNYMKIFRNGVEEATKPNMTSFVPVASQLHLGKFAGQMAEFRMWNVARNADDIRSTMHSSLSNNAPNLLVYYRFNQKPLMFMPEFATGPGQAGSQDGELIGDANEVDPLWQTPTGSPSWQTSDPSLKALQVINVPDGATNIYYLPAWDAENGLALTWHTVTASTGKVTQVAGPLWRYVAPVGYDGPDSITYSVRDAANHSTTASINLRVFIAQNDPPTIAAIPNVAAEENVPAIEIPFTVTDDRPASELKITPVVLINGDFIDNINVSPGGSYRTLTVVPKQNEIGTVHVRLLVEDAGGKTAQTEFDLRIEPKPAYAVFDLGVLPGKSASFGTAINDRGAVTGYMADTADLESNPVGFFFNGIENGGVVENNPPVQVGPAPLSSPFRPWAINNTYALAGAARNGGSTVAWHKGIESALVNLGLLPGGAIAEARSLNNNDYLTGFGDIGGKKHAILFTPGAGGLTDLGFAQPPFDDQSQAFGINENNYLVGAIFASDGRKRAMIYKGGVMQPLFSVPEDTNSVAYALNSFDQVVGSATTFSAGDTALSFDGVDDRVVQDNLLTNPGGLPLVAGDAAHTVEAWIKLNAPTPDAAPIRVGSGNFAHGWTVNGDSTLSVGILGRPNASVPLTLGAWTHIAATYDPPLSRTIVYVNGKAFGTNDGAANLAGIPLTLGNFQASGPFFNGALDEVRIWRTTRTPAQISANYNQRLTGAEPGLVVYFPFDEGAGSATTTSLAAGHLVANLSGNPQWTVRAGLPSPDISVSDPVLQLDGVSSYAVGPVTDLANKSFTIEFRARRSRIATTETIVSQGTNQPNKGLQIGFRANNVFTFAFGNNDLDSDVYTDTDWHHWACTLNVANGERKIYRDGVLVKQNSAAAAYQGGGPIFLGQFLNGNWFKGFVDDLRIWNLVRTPEEIAGNQDARLVGAMPGLLSYYTFDEGGGNATVNRVVGGGDISLQGAITWAGRDSGTRRAFLYESVSGRLHSLGTVSGGDASEARAINEFGQIVGTASKGNGTRAFFYSAGRMNDINDLLPEEDQLDQWTLESAAGINRSGAIVGTGTHRGLKRAFLAAPATVIGRPVIRPQGAVERLPQVTILKKHKPDDSAVNSFYWSEVEKKLYAIRPVTAKIEWFTSFSDTIGTGTDAVINTNRIVSVSVNVWPRQPIIHVAGAPVDVLPAYTAATYTFQNLIYNFSNAAVEPSSKTFTSIEPGYVVIYYLKTDGQSPDPGVQRPYFEVVRTVPWNDSHANLTSRDWTIGQEVVDPGHTEYLDKNGYVLFEKAAYDAIGTDRAYDRGTRLGPILPVNTEKPGGNVLANPDPLLVVWYRTNRIGVAWASVPIRYSLNWPSDSGVSKIIIASQFGSGELDPLEYPAKTIYSQPDITQPGFNPNEEHAYMPNDKLFAIRNDLNAIKNYSQPYALLKYRDPDTTRWRMRVYKVIAEESPYFFSYAGVVGKEVQPPLPLSLLPLCDESYQQPPTSDIGWEDYKGKIYARRAGPNGAHDNLVIRWFYPMQPTFFHPEPNVKVGDALAWLDRRAANRLFGPNAGAGVPNTPIDVTYDIRWDDHHVLQIGETLLHSKHGLPDVFNMANAQVIFDSVAGDNPAAAATLARFYDPISARTLTSGVIIPDTLKRQNINGKDYFTDLPWMLKIRLSYDPINRWLSFSGYLDENFGVGEPLLLPNVLTARERDRIKKLADGDTAWSALIDRLYNLTRNPNNVDLSPRDRQPDIALRLGLTTDPAGNVVTEKFAGGPKALTAGIGGLPAAQPRPGSAVNIVAPGGWISVGPNTNNQYINLAGSAFTIEFWAKPTAPINEQYIVGQPGGAANFGRLRIGFRAGGKIAFDLGTTPSSDSLFTTPGAYTDTNWHHWACTFNPETKVQNIYRDGALVATRTKVELTYTGFGVIEIGRFGALNFFGQIDEFRIWKSERTGAEIRSRMNKQLLGVQTPQPSGEGSELNLELLYRFDESSGSILNFSFGTQGNYGGAFNGAGIVRVASTAPTGIPPRYVTIAENNDASLQGLPVALHVIRIDDGPFLGDLKVLPGENVFDERITLRHSSDFGGDPNPLTFQWFYKPIGPDFDPTDLPMVTDSTAQFPSDMRGWTHYANYEPPSGAGVNFVTTGEGGESGLITLSDNAFICRYRGYNVNLNTDATWSGWIGDPAGTPDQPRAALAEGWVKRVVRGLNPFDARTRDFHSSPAATFASMLIQAGGRYEGPIAFNPGADAINKIGLIEAYTTVLERAKGLSIDGVPQVDFNPANASLQLAATKISDLYVLLGNEAYADASDPTIGFGSGSREYGSLASSIFAFQNQLDSLLDEELVLLRGRDDSAAGVGARPVYNRLFWNFTLGEGEIAYQQNYNISDQDNDGFITEKDARILYPQGHGDAWGHYLTALRHQYALLRHPFFTWIPRSELVSVAGAAIKVDFLDERKFAIAAAAKAKAGAEIVDLTYRLNYVDDPSGQWQGYKDTKPDRAWGVTEWARRAAIGAYFDWITGNAILPSEDPNPEHTGIDKIDRQTVRELFEIPPQLEEIQTRLDQADAGLNPLGLAKGVVPFDIDPSLIAAGKTHYEQIQDRALKAMNNAMAVWDEVNKATQELRKNQDSVEQFAANVADQERDYKNRLIEIFGYPYAGEIGPSKTYPSGYDGPDIYHYMYVSTTEYTTQTAELQQYSGFFKSLPITVPSADGSASLGAKIFPADVPNASDALMNKGDVFKVQFPFSPGDWGFAALPGWGQRRAPGEIQLALSQWVEQQTRLKQSSIAYGNLMREIEDSVDLLNARYQLHADILTARNTANNTSASLRHQLVVMKALENVMLVKQQTVSGGLNATIRSVPLVVGLANDAFSSLRGNLEYLKYVFTVGYIAARVVVKNEIVNLEEDLVSTANAEELAIDNANFSFEVKQDLAKLEALIRKAALARADIFTQTQVTEQAQGRWLAALAKGQRLLEERVSFRQRVAAQTTESRYQDMTFRVFRNDALQKYRATFDLAQRYVFLAATAYDYESNLLGTDTRGGSAFLTDIIRQRSLGQMLDGLPVTGRSGLADPLKRMSSNFDVLKTQLGFNNPQTETGRFSLRSELFRLRNSSGDAWRAQLTSSRVENLWDLPEFRRYCRSFAPESAGPQPGIVIRFPSRVLAGLNFFNWPLGGGDSAYDPSRFATRIRSAGVWFTGYNGLGLSQTPRVYLVPVGADVLSSPTPNNFVTREWRVVDQALPVPFEIGANRLADPKWIPINDSLGGSFAEIRRFASFRAYHDSGDFSQSEVTTDSRLIGRSVWNTDWMLIIPGQTFLADADTGLDTFVDSVTDIKLFFQTYSYSGN